MNAQQAPRNVSETFNDGIGTLTFPRDGQEAVLPRWSKGALRLARRKPLGAIALVFMTLLITTALLAPVIAPFDVAETHPYERLATPNSTYIMGTDKFGRDVFSRILFGARTDLLIAGLSAFVGVSVGAVIGLVTGYRAGSVFDHLLQRLIDVQMTVPPLIMAIAIITGVGQGFIPLIAVIALHLIPTTSRVLRGAAIAQRSLQYVDAAHAMGCSEFRIMFRHILPNILAPLLVLLSLALGTTLLIVGSLSYLGYGPPPPTPTLGALLNGDNREVIKSAPWLSIFPGLVLAMAVFSFNMLGDAVRDLLDPRLRGN